LLRKINFYVYIVALVLMFSGCASNPPISSLTNQERERVQNIIFLETKEIPKDSYENLGTVEGLACKRNLYASGAPTINKARQGVKIRAAKLGANAVLNVMCEENHEVDWIRNCWQSVVCVGDAIKIKDQSIISSLQGTEHKKQQPKEEKIEEKDILMAGTGWVVSPGFIVTNNHLIDETEKITGHFKNGKSIKLSIAASDPINDIALLLPKKQQKGKFPKSLPLANDVASVGETVFTVGYPHTNILGSNAKVTSGIISSKTGLRDDPRLYQTTVQLQAGNSGGPLLNMDGEAIGIATSKLDAVKVFQYTGDLTEGINYAIKSHYIAALIASTEISQKFEVLETDKGPFKNLEEAVQGVNDSVLLIKAH